MVHHAPSAATTQHVQYAVYDLAHVGGARMASSPGRRMVGNEKLVHYLLLAGHLPGWWRQSTHSQKATPFS